jgi:hypothetical protein
MNTLNFARILLASTITYCGGFLGCLNLWAPLHTFYTCCIRHLVDETTLGVHRVTLGS